MELSWGEVSHLDFRAGSRIHVFCARCGSALPGFRTSLGHSSRNILQRRETPFKEGARAVAWLQEGQTLKEKALLCGKVCEHLLSDREHPKGCAGLGLSLSLAVLRGLPHLTVRAHPFSESC